MVRHESHAVAWGGAAAASALALLATDDPPNTAHGFAERKMDGHPALVALADAPRVLREVGDDCGALGGRAAP